MNIPETLYKNFNTANNKTCMVINEEAFTYAEITSMITSVQKSMKNTSTTQLIGVEVNNTPWTYAAILACWFMGKGFVPLHPAHPLKRNQEIIKLTGLKEIISSEKENENLPKNIKKLVPIEKNNPKELTKAEISKEKLACVLFTSGSTGIPKGVPMTFRNIESTMDAFFALNYNLGPQDKFLQMFELTFDMSMLSYLPAWMLGASVYTVGYDKIKYLEAINIMKNHAVTFAAMVPSTLSLLKPYFEKIKLPDLKYSVLGGEPFYEDLAQAWHQSIPNSEIINISGPTETTMACMGYKVDTNFKENKTHNGILAFGQPWKNTLAIIIDQEQNILNNQDVGELCFSGENVMSGYLNQPELNKQVFFETTYKGKTHRFYRTGDMAFVDEDGVFQTCGRQDRQVKIQGFKVELEEVEKVARSLEGVKNACAMKSSKMGNTQIQLFIETTTITLEEIKKNLSETLPYYMQPSEVKIKEYFPYTMNGKIDRVKLQGLSE